MPASSSSRRSSPAMRWPRKRVEMAIITFGPVRVLQDFVTADLFAPTAARDRRRHADGRSHPGGARARELQEAAVPGQRRRLLPAVGLPDHRRRANRRLDGRGKAVKAAEKAKALAFFPVGVEGADMEMLQQLSVQGADQAQRPDVPRAVPVAVELAVGCVALAGRRAPACCPRPTRHRRAGPASNEARCGLGPQHGRSAPRTLGAGLPCQDAFAASVWRPAAGPEF